MRIFHLLRETAREFDIILYAFTEDEIAEADLAPVLEFVATVYLVQKPRYREPRWSTLAPPEVCEYQSPAMRKLWRARQADVAQVEYTYLAILRRRHSGGARRHLRSLRAGSSPAENRRCVVGLVALAALRIARRSGAASKWW